MTEQLSFVWVDQPPESAQGFVYLVEAVGSGLVKIGRTGDLATRLKHLRIGTQFPLRVLKVISGGASVETALHRRFAKYRERGEWFALESIRSEIADLESVVVRMPACVDCGELNYGGKRCRTCWVKHKKSLARRLLCTDCGGNRTRGRLRCRSCWRKRLKRPCCVDCGKELSRSRNRRCKACNGRYVGSLCRHATTQLLLEAAE